MAEGFAAVPTWMIRDTENVSKNALLVYASLASRAGLRTNMPGQALLASEARCSERTVRDALAELVDLGVVERVRRGSKTGGRATDAYRLMDRPLARDEFPATAAGKSELPAEPAGVTGRSEQVTPSIEVDRTEVDIPQTPRGGRELAKAVQALTESEDLYAAFQSFYSIYPRKVGKEAALRAFAKAARRVGGFQVIIDGARRFAHDPNLPTDRQFIPHPATWLNGGRWEDEPLPPRAGSQSGTAMERMVRQLRGSEGEEVRRELGA